LFVEEVCGGYGSWGYCAAEKEESGIDNGDGVV
jgi:hypothetical protein